MSEIAAGALLSQPVETLDVLMDDFDVNDFPTQQMSLLDYAMANEREDLTLFLLSKGRPLR